MNDKNMLGLLPKLSGIHREWAVFFAFLPDEKLPKS